MNIEKVSNGYIVEGAYGNKEVFATLQEVFEHLLVVFEGKASTFTGESYGEVIIKTLRE